MSINYIPGLKNPSTGALESNPRNNKKQIIAVKRITPSFREKTTFHERSISTETNGLIGDINRLGFKTKLENNTITFEKHLSGFNRVMIHGILSKHGYGSSFSFSVTPEGKDSIILD